MSQVYEGGCHCGAVRYEVEAELGTLVSCNCSICSKTGTLLTFVPESQFRLLSGEDALTDYRFNQEVIAHLFCKHCGIRSFARGKDPQGHTMVAINARCLDGVAFDDLPKHHFDGRSA